MTAACLMASSLAHAGEVPETPANANAPRKLDWAKYESVKHKLDQAFGGTAEKLKRMNAEGKIQELKISEMVKQAHAQRLAHPIALTPAHAGDAGSARQQQFLADRDRFLAAGAETSADLEPGAPKIGRLSRDRMKVMEGIPLFSPAGQAAAIGAASKRSPEPSPTPVRRSLDHGALNNLLARRTAAPQVPTSPASAVVTA
ncbi:hypothetical protein D3H34_31075 [Acidovorax cavernicola]|uniref:Uncharacterized protein n=2 Tax=Acidovorax cavernicola TaxID=1675792 RepID=A0A9X8CYF4_9BURK|nr:hypothetical protein D3H34_31075 [Acidovorax cavernicola]